MAWRWWLPFLLCSLLPAQAGEAAATEAGPLPEGAPPAMLHVQRSRLEEHARFLASDDLGGRFTTSKGQQKAAEYIAEHFKQLGLKPLGDRRTFFQSYPLEKTWLDASTQLSFGSERIASALAVVPSSGSDKVNLSGRFVWCGDASPEQVPSGLRGRIPVAFVPRARGQGRAGSMGALQRVEAVARQFAGSEAQAGVLCLLEDNHPLADALNQDALLPDHPQLKYKGQGRASRGAAIPILVLARAGTEKLLAHLKLSIDEDGRVQGEADARASGRLAIQVKTDPKASAVNVVAVLEGKGMKREAVVYSAHMDHMGTRLDGDPFNGADDNASGSSGLLAIAEAFAKADEPPARSIVFLSVSGEELGLWGSAHFADNPCWPLEQIVANINIDMIGRNTELSGEDAISVTPSREHGKYSTLVRKGHELARRMGIAFTSGDTYYERSDHYNFAKKGVPVVFFCDGEHADYHKVTDHADKLDYRKMERVARLAFWLGWETAEDKGRPKDLGAQKDW